MIGSNLGLDTGCSDYSFGFIQFFHKGADMNLIISEKLIAFLVGRCEVSQMVTLVWRHVVWYIVTNISEECAASILRSSTRLRGVTYNKTVIFVVKPVWTSNFTLSLNSYRRMGDFLGAGGYQTRSAVHCKAELKGQGIICRCLSEVALNCWRTWHKKRQSLTPGITEKVNANFLSGFSVK